MWKNVARTLSRLEWRLNIPELVCEVVRKNEVQFDIAPYQIILVNSQKVWMISGGVAAERTAGGTEMCYKRSEGKASVWMRDCDRMWSLNAGDGFFVHKTSFVMATSKVKVLENEAFDECLGEGTVVVAAEELVRVEEEEEVMVQTRKLGGFGSSITKDLVKIDGFTYWRIKGPGVVAIKDIGDVNLKTEEKIQAKDMSQGDNTEDKSILSEILKGNDILI
jgi:hypothetical protein